MSSFIITSAAVTAAAETAENPFFTFVRQD
jgi:hypothetical protein